MDTLAARRASRSQRVHPCPKNASERATFCHTHDRLSSQVRPLGYDGRACGSRFLEVDPVEGGSANDYEYTAGDPVDAYDLDGEAVVVAVGIAVGVVVIGGVVIHSANKKAARKQAQQRKQRARKQAQEEGAKLLEGLKRLNRGRGQSGRSGSGGDDLKKVGAQLIRDANKLPANDPLREALKG